MKVSIFVQAQWIGDIHNGNIIIMGWKHRKKNIPLIRIPVIEEISYFLLTEVTETQQ